jgi:hypothetical protein
MKVVQISAGIGAPVSPLLELAVEEGLLGAALVDRNGNTVGLAGAIDEEAAMPLVALVLYRLKRDDLSARLFTGEVLHLSLDDRDVAVCIARRQLFVVAILPPSTPGLLARVDELRDDVESILANASGDVPLPWRGNGGSGSGPAEIPLIEWGVTVRRERGKA